MDICGDFGLNWRMVQRIFLALVVSAGIACAVAPAAEELQAIQPGVTVLGRDLGGLTVEPAQHRIQAIVDRPIAVWFRGRRLSVSPARLGLDPDVDPAVARALKAEPGQALPVRLGYSAAAVSAYVETLAQRFDRAPRASRLVGATAKGPILTPARLGLQVQQGALALALEQELGSGTRQPLVLPVAAVQPRRAVDRVIVVDRDTNTLRLFSAGTLVRRFAVATGQAIYPTPTGIFRIVDKQRDPWWYPPTYDSWAKGLKPVPPGPDNPLGTRWMGLSIPGVGIHGTDEPTSIGYSESHGCIRMEVPDAEWLFDHVRVGTPVVIL